MQITVVAVICHMLSPIPEPVCHEEIVVKDDMSMQMCMLAEPGVAEWKERSIYRGDQWRILRIMCKPGDYEPRDAI
jgi:hypothetical protein